MLTDPLSKKHNKWFCFTGWLLTVWLFSTYTFTMVLTEWINYQSERFVIRPVWDHSIRELSSDCGMFINMLFIVLFFLFFSVRHLSDLRGHSVFFSSQPQRPPTSKDFYTRSYPLHYFLILILEKEALFPFWMLSAKQGTTGTIFITTLVWGGPWLGIEPRTRCQHSTTRLSRRRSLTGIEPGTSRTRSQHSTTRLSRRRLCCLVTARLW